MEEQIKFYNDKLRFEMDSADLYETISTNQNIIIVDTRTAEAFELEHIPGAINIPHRTMTLESMKQFDKNALFVSYCDGIGCNGSTKGAINLAKLGFTVKELIGGLDWWKRDGYETHGTKASKGKTVTCGC